MDKMDFLDFLKILYSTLLHLPPFRFHCVRGCRIKPRTIATLALAARRSNQSARSHPYSARSHPKARPDLIHSRPDLVQKLGQISSAFAQISSKSSARYQPPLGQISSKSSARSHPHSAHPKSARSHPKTKVVWNGLAKSDLRNWKQSFSKFSCMKKDFLIFSTVQ